MLRKTPLKAKTGFKRPDFKTEMDKKAQKAKKYFDNPVYKAVSTIGTAKPKKKIKRTPEHKLRYEKISTLENRIWPLCRQITRKTYCHEDGTATCYTCGKLITDKGDMHTGHWRKKSLLSMIHKYDLRFLKIQCEGCNKWRNGEEAEYTIHLVKDYGADYVSKLDQEWKEAKQHLKGSADNRIFLQELEKKYKQMI